MTWIEEHVGTNLPEKKRRKELSISRKRGKIIFLYCSQKRHLITRKNYPKALQEMKIMLLPLGFPVDILV